MMTAIFISCDTATESQNCLHDCETDYSKCSGQCDVEYYASCYEDCAADEDDCKDDCGGGGCGD